MTTTCTIRSATAVIRFALNAIVLSVARNVFVLAVLIMASVSIVCDVLKTASFSLFTTLGFYSRILISQLYQRMHGHDTPAYKHILLSLNYVL